METTKKDEKVLRFIILFNSGYFYTYTGSHLPGFYLHLLSIKIVKSIFNCDGNEAYINDEEGSWKSLKITQIANNNIG